VNREEFEKFAALSSKLVDVVHDEIHDQGELGLPVILAALFDTACFWVAQCPLKARQDMVRQFRESLLESLEANIEVKAEIKHPPIALPTTKSQALCLANGIPAHGVQG
jgi:hypothetical protein